MRPAPRFLLLAGALSVACAAAPPEPDPLPVRSAAPKPRAAPAAADPALESFRENLERAQSDAERAGWRVKEIVEIPGHHSALVIYRPDARHAQKSRIARVDAVSAGEYSLITNQSGVIDVLRAPGGALTWDLRGDGRSSVVVNLTPCSSGCGVPKPLTLELDGDRFFSPKSVPECPSCMHDDNHDGVPEFERGLVKLVIAPCSRASCGPSAELLVEVRGLESWDGQKYAQDLTELQPLYFERLKKARLDADGVRREANKGKICPLGAIQAAAELFVYSRFIGESRQDALRQADGVMRGYDTAPCTKQYELTSAPKSWGELSYELEKVELPALERKRVR